MSLKEKENLFIEEVFGLQAADSNGICIYPAQMLDQFIDYWTEPNRSGTKMKFELEKTWDTKRRLQRWFNNQNKWNGKVIGLNQKPKAGTVSSGGFGQL